jgi:selenocysteine lyase/cysteine desulfurase
LVVATEIEHNSVLRPLQAWAARGWIRLEIVPCDRSGQIDWGRWEALLRQRPWLVCANHASNVTGIIQPVAQMGEGCRQAGAWFLVDAAQTLGWIPLDVEQLSCDILVAAGHKALHGPLGTGLAYFRRAIQPAIASLRMGGTGSWGPAMDSQIAGPPKWEAGNLNVPGLLGWAAALSQGNDPPRQAWDVESSARAVATRLEHARRLCSRLWTGLERIPGVRLVAHPGGDPFGGQSPRLPIISLTVEGWDPSELAVAMESAGGFVTRAGYHCAPLIHASLGTTVGGTWRLSLGPDNTVDQVERFLQTLKAVCA